MNVKTVFLHGELEETIYKEQLEGFVYFEEICVWVIVNPQEMVLSI